MNDDERPAITLNTGDSCAFHYGSSHEEHMKEMERRLDEADRRIALMSKSRCEAEYMGRRCELPQGHTRTQLTQHRNTDKDGHVVRWPDERSDNKTRSDVYNETPGKGW